MCPSNYNRFWDRARYGRKSSIFHPPFYSTPPLGGGFPSEYRHTVWYGKTRMVWLPDGEKISKISLFVLAQLTNVTDGQTDRQTDRHRVTAYTALMHMHRAVKIRQLSIVYYRSVRLSNCKTHDDEKWRNFQKAGTLHFHFLGEYSKLDRVKTRRTRGKTNAIWRNIKINLQKLVDIIDINCQQICEISRLQWKYSKTFYGILVIETPCTSSENIIIFLYFQNQPFYCYLVTFIIHAYVTQTSKVPKMVQIYCRKF